MRMLAATLFSFCLFVGGAAAAEQASDEGANAMPKPEDIRAVAPALESTPSKSSWTISGCAPVFPLATAASSHLLR